MTDEIILGVLAAVSGVLSFVVGWLVVKIVEEDINK
jgi:hypothetical protein